MIIVFPRTALALAGSLAVALSGGCAAEMSALPGGTFEMGSLRGEAVTVAGFRMDVTEVTVDAYRACVSRGACTPAAADYGCNWTDAGRGSHPINCVDSTQATAYCRVVGKRLPTEAEWEWAARGGEAGTTYPWGNDDPTSRACWDGDGRDPFDPPTRKRTCAVGAFAQDRSPQGIRDLAGNAWEWTSSSWNAGGSHRVVRGGSYHDVLPVDLRAAARRGVASSSQYNVLGFRCVADR